MKLRYTDPATEELEQSLSYFREIRILRKLPNFPAYDAGTFGVSNIRFSTRLS
jgi:hypothetical protein